VHTYSWWSRGVVATAGIALLASAGCGGYSVGKSDAVPANTYAYVSEGGSTASIAQFQVASDGSFTALNPPSIAVDNLSLTADPSGKYLFADGSENDLTPGVILQFVIGSDGTLAANSVPSVGARNQPSALVFTPNGHFALTTNGDNTVSSYALSPTGSLSLVNTVLAGFGADSAVIDSSGQFAYVLAGGTNTPAFTITEYSISPSGVLNLVVTYPLDLIDQNGEPDPGAMVISPKGFLYLTEYTPPSDGTAPGAIVEFSINEANGGLSVLNTYSTTDTDPGPIIFDPTGAYAYVNNGESLTISQFTVDASTGALTQNGPDVPGSISTGAVASGTFLFATQGLSSSPPQVSRFTINSDGTLTPNGAATSLGDNTYPFSLIIVQQ